VLNELTHKHDDPLRPISILLWKIDFIAKHNEPTLSTQVFVWL
jgi:hypothetical protein